MNILFVASGSESGEPGIIVKNQAEALQGGGMNIKFFLVQGKGFKGYIKSVIPLRKYLKNNHVDVVHSHYSLSAIVTTIAMLLKPSPPHIVSLMGSDARIKGKYKFILKIFSNVFWTQTIVKSKQMLVDSGIKNALILANGVSIKKVEEIEKKIFALHRNSMNKKKTILFPADPSRESKNFHLAKSSVAKSNGNMKVVYNKSHEEIIKEIIKADLLLLTSLWEGSPNIVKEAMACNCPVVATDVGDIRWLFGDEQGYFLTSFNPEDVADKIKQALIFSEENGRTNGRQRIIELGLDSEIVAKKIIGVYKEVLGKRERVRRVKYE